MRALHINNKNLTIIVVAATVAALLLPVLTWWLWWEICSYMMFWTSPRAPFRDKLVAFEEPSIDDYKGPKVRYGFIDHNGKLIIKDQFDDAGAFHEQRAPVRSGDDWSFIDASGRKLPTEEKPAKFSRVQEFSEGLAAARGDTGFWGFIDRNCQWVIKPSWRRVETFHTGVAVVHNLNLIGRNPTGIIDKQGNYLVQPGDCELGDEINGARRLRVSDQVGFLNTKGQISIKPQYKDALPFFESKAAVLCKNDKWGFIDPSGLMVVPATYDTAGCFRQGLASASQGGVFGLIDHSGKFVVKPQFEFLSAIYFRKAPKPVFSSEGMTPIAFNNRWGFAGRDGKIAIAPQYVDEDTFSEGLAVVGIKREPPRKQTPVAEESPIAKASEENAEPVTYTVVYAKRDIAIGEEIPEDALEERETKKLPPHAYQNIYEVIGRTATKKLSAGKVIDDESTKDSFYDSSFEFNNKIKEGSRAITFSLTCRHVPDTLTPGKHVDVVSLSEFGNSPPTFTPLLHNTRIRNLSITLRHFLA